MRQDGPIEAKITKKRDLFKMIYKATMRRTIIKIESEWNNVIFCSI